MFNTNDLFDENSRLASMVPEAMSAWLEKFKNKNNNYGNSWLLTGETISLWFPRGIKLETPRQHIMYGLITRMLDKMIRAAHIELADREDKVGEKTSETFFDLGVYGFMAGTACFMGYANEKFKEALKGQASGDSKKHPLDPVDGRSGLQG